MDRKQWRRIIKKIFESDMRFFLRYSLKIFRLFVSTLLLLSINLSCLILFFQFSYWFCFLYGVFLITSCEISVRILIGQRSYFSVMDVYSVNRLSTSSIHIQKNIVLIWARDYEYFWSALTNIIWSNTDSISDTEIRRFEKDITTGTATLSSDRVWRFHWGWRRHPDRFYKRESDLSTILRIHHIAGKEVDDWSDHDQKWVIFREQLSIFVDQKKI